MIFEDTRGHLVILIFSRAQTKDSLRKRTVKYEVEVLDTPIFNK